jgi:hypothetical protein
LENKKYLQSKVAYSPPSTATGSLADHLKPAGSYNDWKETVKVYDALGLSHMRLVSLLLWCTATQALELQGWHY